MGFTKVTLLFFVKGERGEKGPDSRLEQNNASSAWMTSPFGDGAGGRDFFLRRFAARKKVAGVT